MKSIPFDTTIVASSVTSPTTVTDTAHLGTGVHVIDIASLQRVDTVTVVVTPGGAAIQDVALEPAQVRLQWSPQAIEAEVDQGGMTTRTLIISDTGPIPLDVALFEINLDFTERPPIPDDLSGKRILYDRAHGQPASGDYSVLVNDAIAAGAVVDENWYFPIDELVLDGYDILWTNCCGGVSNTRNLLQHIRLEPVKLYRLISADMGLTLGQGNLLCCRLNARNSGQQQCSPSTAAVDDHAITRWVQLLQPVHALLRLEQVHGDIDRVNLIQLNARTARVIHGRVDGLTHHLGVERLAHRLDTAAATAQVALDLARPRLVMQRHEQAACRPVPRPFADIQGFTGFQVSVYGLSGEVDKWVGHGSHRLQVASGRW